MATLQAARAKRLGFTITEAKSWGLNRAIFYAAAKRGFKKTKPPRRRSREEITKKPVQKGRRSYFLGDEMAYASKRGDRTYFTIGGKLQTENDFKRQIEARLGAKFPEAWKEALEIMKQYTPEVLLSQNRFFGDVYRPRRDELAAKWTEMSEYA